ncbi:MAG: nucleotidyltransferase family protein [Rhodothermales bacterium]
MTKSDRKKPVFVSGILLAAGLSSRMGEANKLLMPLGGLPLVLHAARALGEAPLGECMAVVGHEGDQVGSVLQGVALRCVPNAGYASGMTSSIQAGVRAASESADGYLIMLGDMPLVRPATLALLVDALEAGGIVVPVYRGTRGNPVLFSSAYRDEILAHEEPEGCRGILKRHAARVVEVPVDDEGVLRDVDTENAFEELKSHHAHRKMR